MRNFMFHISQIVNRTSLFENRDLQIVFSFSQIAFRKSHFAFRISHFTNRISHFAFCKSHITNCISLFANHISQIVFHISLFTFCPFLPQAEALSQLASPNRDKSITPASPRGDSKFVFKVCYSLPEQRLIFKNPGPAPSRGNKYLNFVPNRGIKKTPQFNQSLQEETTSI